MEGQDRGTEPVYLRTTVTLPDCPCKVGFRPVSNRGVTSGYVLLGNKKSGNGIISGKEVPTLDKPGVSRLRTPTVGSLNLPFLGLDWVHVREEDWVLPLVGRTKGPYGVCGVVGSGHERFPQWGPSSRTHSERRESTLVWTIKETGVTPTNVGHTPFSYSMSFQGLDPSP